MFVYRQVTTLKRHLKNSKLQNQTEHHLGVQFQLNGNNLYIFWNDPYFKWFFRSKDMRFTVCLAPWYAQDTVKYRAFSIWERTFTFPLQKYFICFQTRLNTISYTMVDTHSSDLISPMAPSCALVEFDSQEDLSKRRSTQLQPGGRPGRPATWRERFPAHMHWFSKHMVMA